MKAEQPPLNILDYYFYQLVSKQVLFAILLSPHNSADHQINEYDSFIR